MAEKIRVMIPEEEVDAKIRELGQKISEKFAGEEVHLICILKGSVFFVCELAKRITVPVTIDFMQVSSYGAETKSSGVVRLSKDLDEPLQGKNVIIVEDIIDSGRTLSHLVKLLGQRNPKTMTLCTLLDKPDRRVVDVDVEYTGFTIPDEFVVGSTKIPKNSWLKNTIEKSSQIRLRHTPRRFRSNICKYSHPPKRAASTI